MLIDDPNVDLTDDEVFDQYIKELDEYLEEVRRDLEWAKKDKIEKVIEFLHEKFPDKIELYRVRLFPSSSLNLIYHNDCIALGHNEGWRYIDIYGVTEEEYEKINKECGS